MQDRNNNEEDCDLKGVWPKTVDIASYRSEGCTILKLGIIPHLDIKSNYACVLLSLFI